MNPVLTFRLSLISSVFILALFVFPLSSSYSQTTLTFTSSGSWTVPCGVTSATITIWGGGGGGGGDATNGFPAGSGGGSGAYVRYLNLPVISGNVYNFTVGAGGAGVSGGNGTGGGTSTFTGPGATLTASGGAGGGANGGAGGAGGATATGGTTNTVGIAGQTATAIMTVGGSGSGAPNGGGNVASCGTDGCTGTIGSLYGGGGSGGGPRGGGSNSIGGAGRQGVVVITYTSTISQPTAGPDQTQCGGLVMAGNAVPAGWTGTWSVVSGTATIVAPNNPTTTVTGIPSGTCATLRWTFSMAGCPSVTDDVVLCNPVVCNDNACTATPLTVNTSCTYNTYNSAGATLSNSMPEPGCGSFLDNDVWFSAVVPANGQIQFSGVDAAGGGTFYLGMAVYNGTCGNLMHHGCDYTTSGLTPATLVYNGTPGETVYIRVWDYLDTEGAFQLCAYTHTNATGTVMPGDNTIACGGPVQTWMDPGGTGNYLSETSAFYQICPSIPGQYVTVSFSSFNLENGFDYLTVMNGAGSFDPIIGNYTGSALPATITSSAADGCLAFQFRTDNVGTAAGWSANVTCSATPGTNTVICTSTNCAGNCGQWVCQDGLYPTDNQGSASVEEITEQTGGCFGGIGEISTKWFYFTILTSGTIGITFDGPTGQDYDFAIWGPSSGGEPACPSNTGLSPIRCSYAAAPNPVGLGNGATDNFEDAAGNGWVAELNVIAGETYSMLMNIFQNGNPQPIIDINFTGTGTLDCTPVTPLPIELLSFKGTYSDGFNRIQWESATELNNDYYTLFYSDDAMNWKVVNVQQGAGNSNIALGYAYSHISPYEVSYYKLRQTDYDGNFKEFGPISLVKSGTSHEIFVNVYPNPAHGQLNINVSQPGNLTYHLFDNLGREVVTSVAGFTGSDVLDIQMLPAGIYQLVVESGSQVVHSGRVVIN